MTFKPLRILLFCLLLLATAPAMAANLDFVANTSEAVTVDTSGGTPRLPLTVGAASRFANYLSGSGTNALTFRYAVQAGDFDADGIAVTSPVDLNGGTIRDVAGNNLNPVYTPPATGNVKVQTYTVAFVTNPINAGNQTAVQLQLAKAPVGGTYNYTITSSGGGGSVTGSGSVTASPQTISGVNVSTLPAGTLTVSLTVTAASGTGLARTATATKAAFSGILDSLPTPAAAYSLRLLRSAYAGPLVQVRRASDNATQDINPTGAGDLDETALLAFCGSSSCYVQTWYDQSGNGINATQSTAASQPQLVNAGTIQRMGSKAGVQIAANNQALVVSGITWNAYTLSTVIRHASLPTDVRTLAIKRVSTATSEFFWFVYSSNSNHITWDQNGTGTGARFDTGFTPSLGTNYVYSLVRPLSGSNRTQYVNGVVRGTTATNGDVSNNLALTIGNDPGIMTRGLDGTMGEFIVWTSALSDPNRMTLESNQSGYYTP